MELTPGLVLPELTVTVDRETPQAYAVASGDHNPIHVNDDAARAIGLPGSIAHGMWTMGAALRLLTQAGIGPDRVRRTSCKFGRPLPIPDAGGQVEVRISGEVTRVEAGMATVAMQVHLGADRLAKVEANVVE